MEVTVTSLIIGTFSTNHRRISTGTGGLGNKRSSGDHPNYSIIKIGQKTKKSPRDFRRLVEDR